MLDDDPSDDEDWYDDGDDLGDDDLGDEEDAVRCPECGGWISGFTDKCAACGYWLSAVDRRQLRSEGVKPWWVTLTAVVLLMTFLATLLWWS